MLYSFKIQTRPLLTSRLVTVIDGSLEYVFPARKGDSVHYYSNIPVLKKPEVHIFGYEGSFVVTDLALGGASYLPPLQRKLNRGLARDRNVTYQVKVVGDPRHAIITFPHFKGRGGPEAPYPILNAGKFQFDNTVFISFQDPYLALGSYFLTDNYGKDPVTTAVSVIRRILSKFGLNDSNASFVGSSKGANIAALVSSHFDSNQLILCAYSTELEYRLRNSHFVHLATALDFFGIRIPDSLEILKAEASRKEAHWFYSIGDDMANRGHEDTKALNLTSYPSEVGHSAVILDNWQNIHNLIHAYRVDT